MYYCTLGDTSFSLTLQKAHVKVIVFAPNQTFENLHQDSGRHVRSVSSFSPVTFNEKALQYYIPLLLYYILSFKQLEHLLFCLLTSLL